ncbi:hypothetical protein T03_14825 [Trichinella britovi]|uniref:Uncharacterized protein n=1 Tax=Trichinella britovi TaxID=45882 RepID=A0A0V1D4I4_TRIBR|nr:hypothetical protein T03_14825 [Trichinella britovi]
MLLPRWPEMMHRRSECLCERRRVAATGGASPTKKSAGRRKTEPYNTSVVKQLMSSFNAVPNNYPHISNNTRGSIVVHLTLALCMSAIRDALGWRWNRSTMPLAYG